MPIHVYSPPFRVSVIAGGAGHRFVIRKNWNLKNDFVLVKEKVRDWKCSNYVRPLSVVYIVFFSRVIACRNRETVCPCVNVQVCPCVYVCPCVATNREMYKIQRKETERERVFVIDSGVRASATDWKTLLPAKVIRYSFFFPPRIFAFSLFRLVLYPWNIAKPWTKGIYTYTAHITRQAMRLRSL